MKPISRKPLPEEEVKVDFVDYKLSFTMIPYKDTYIIKCAKGNKLEGTPYVVVDNYVDLLVKYKSIKTKKS